MLESTGEIRTVLAETFGLILAEDDLKAALDKLVRVGTMGVAHPFFN